MDGFLCLRFCGLPLPGMRLLLALGFWVMGLQAGVGQGIVWEKKIGWEGTDQLSDVIATPDGNFIACGTSYYHGADGISTHHDAVCLLSILSNGDSAWFRPTGLYGLGPKLCPGDSEGLYLITTITFTPPINTDAFLMLCKVDYQGQLLWRMPIPGGSGITTRVRRLIKAGNGDLLVVGKQGAMQGTGNTDDMFVLRIDPLNQLIKWKKQYNNNPRTSGNWIEQTPAGTFLASGAAGSRIWAIEIDSNGGEIQRQSFYQTPTLAVFGETACVKQAPGGRYIAAGSPLNYSPGFYFLGSYSSFSSSSKEWGGEKSPAVCLPPHIQADGSLVFYNGRGNTNRYLTKLAGDSSIVWDRLLGSQFGSFSPGIAAFSYLSDSSVIAVGSYYSSATAQDFYFCLIRNVGVPFNPAEPVANRPRHKGLPPLIAYPTPTGGPLTVHTRSSLPLALFSLSGKKLLNAKADLSGTTSLDISGLAKGVYVLRQGENAVRVVKE